MKIIQIVGNANSGKTTFILSLIPELKKRGHVAVIKHLRDHEYLLEKGKDTTAFFERGADISVGIDSYKAVIALRNNRFGDALRFLESNGMDFVILEGFKTRSFKKVVLGDLQINRCILRNPSVDQVLEALPLFEDY
jgi:molybdopterin-guanine dinucleotide biosynthesis protein MobB